MYSATITTQEVREEFFRTKEGKTTIDDPGMAPTIDFIQSGHRDYDFYNTSAPDMADHLDNGFDPPGSLSVTIGGGENCIYPELVWSDEDGELMIDAVLSGEDDYRVQWEDVPSPRSIRVVAQVNMLASTPPEVLKEYCEFILEAVDGAAEQGGSPGLEIVHYVREAVGGENECRFYIPLVNPGEEVDPTAWRAFFSTGGFRVLGFLARGIAAKRDGKRVCYGMGYSTGPGWAVTMENDTLTITAPPSAQRFPREDMERKLQDALA
jgi:hypothetical protein